MCSVLIMMLGTLLLGCGQPDEATPTASATAEAAAAKPFDHALFDEILRAHVKNGFVDYAALKAERETQLDRYLQSLAEVKGFAGQDDELAFWLNAYNAGVIKAVLERYPDIKSVMDIEDFFTIKRWRLAGKTYSFDELENEIIRPKFTDPRVHFVLVCASRSCPPLQHEAMDAARVQSQLEAAAKAAINRRKYVQVDAEAKVLTVTRIMSWYQQDFVDHSGSIQNYVATYIDEPQKSKLWRGQYTVKFMDYDWTLNDISR
ncbi:MAG: DUF547 domain-containing protein [Armatimonadetes bacterium]|nr:DUF547 domain-containing protein [Armatimonadota bacterium]